MKKHCSLLSGKDFRERVERLQHNFKARHRVKVVDKVHVFSFSAILQFEVGAISQQMNFALSLSCTHLPPLSDFLSDAGVS